jgi:type I restriction enzyme S subunit
LGSARETFDWSEMQEVKIPIPDIKIQKAISSVYSTYIERKKINEQLKAQIKNICPILIKGSLEEGKR